MDPGRRAELEAAIEDNPYDRKAYAVLSDHLQELGDPRGELIALQLAAQTADVVERAAAVIATHQLGLPAPVTRIDWRFGFASAIELDPEGATRAEIEAVLDHPTSRFLTSLEICATKAGMQPVIDALAARVRPGLGSLYLGRARSADTTWLDRDSYELGGLDALWSALPELWSLDVHGQHVLGRFDLPELNLLTISSISLRDDTLTSLCAASLSELTSLDLAFGHGRPDLGHLEHLLAHPLPELSALAISGSGFLDELVELLVRSPLLGRLARLSLRDGLTDRGAELIERHAGAFAHLEHLNLTRNYLSPAAVERIASVAKITRTGNQQVFDEPDPDLYDY